MKKRKILCFVLVLTIVSVLMPSNYANAKTKLSETTKTLTIGKSATIKISGAKKVKWSVSNNHIRITKQTNKSAKIKAVSKGTAYLRANTGNITYKCKIIVKTKDNADNNTEKVDFDEKQAKESMNVEEFIANKKLFAKVTSNYKYATDISAKCTFYDLNGNPVDNDSDSVSFLEQGRTCFLSFSLPSVSYSTYKIEYEYSEGLKYFYHLSVIEDLSLTANYVEDTYNPYIMLQVSNAGKEECYSCEVAVVYYDAEGKILDVSLKYISKIASGSSDTTKAFIPYDRDTYEDIIYDHYETFITYAYHLGKAGETH